MIPKRIFQTWKTNEIPLAWQPYQKSWKEKHQDWEFCFATDDDNRAFVTKWFPGFLETYDLLSIPITKVDFVRYLYLYKFGGVYADLDCESLQPLDGLIKQFPNSNILLGLPFDSLRYIECACMISSPLHPFWMEVIESIRDAVERPSKSLRLLKFFNRSLYILALTGPIRLGEVYQEAKNRHTDIELLPSKYFYPKRDSQTTNSYVKHHMSGSWISTSDKFFAGLFQKKCC